MGLGCAGLAKEMEHVNRMICAAVVVHLSKSWAVWDVDMATFWLPLLFHSFRGQGYSYHSVAAFSPSSSSKSTIRQDSCFWIGGIDLRQTTPRADSDREAVRRAAAGTFESRAGSPALVPSLEKPG